MDDVDEQDATTGTRDELVAQLELIARSAPLPTDVRLADLGLDSMDVLQWLHEAEDRLGIDLDDVLARRDVPPLGEATIGTLVDLLQTAEPARAAAVPRPGSRLERVQRLLADRVERGEDRGACGCVVVDGERYDVVVGDNGAGAPMTVDTLVPWTCASKPVGALAWARLADAGHVRLDDLVADVLPEYGAEGKDRITVRRLLTHSTGVADGELLIDAAVNPAPWPELEARLWAAICASAVTARQDVMTYNMIANWLVLDRVLATIEQVPGGEPQRVILAECGADGATLGLDPSTPDDDRAHLFAKRAPQSDEVPFLEGLARHPLPGLGMWGPIRSLARVGTVLLDGGYIDGRQVVSADAVAAMTTTQLAGDSAFAAGILPYGFGVVTDPAVFGDVCSPAAFGHSGGNTAMLLVDPSHRLVAAFFWNGRIDDAACLARHHATTRAVYRDLELTPDR